METINVQKRNFNVKAKKMRRLGLVPGNVFGKSLTDPISIQMEESVARRLIRLNREGSKLVMNIEGQTMPVQIKEKSLNRVNDEILNISFQALSANEKVNSVIHIIVVNDAKIQGVVEKMQLEIPYTSLPKYMIDTITIDVDGMKAGNVITVGEIPELQSDKIELQVDPDNIVLRISEKQNNAPEAVEG